MLGEMQQTVFVPEMNIQNMINSHLSVIFIVFLNFKPIVQYRYMYVDYEYVDIRSVLFKSV